MATGRQVGRETDSTTVLLNKNLYYYGARGQKCYAMIIFRIQLIIFSEQDLHSWTKLLMYVKASTTTANQQIVHFMILFEYHGKNTW